MAANGDHKPLPGIEATHGPLVFQIRLFADGHMEWTSPKSGNPMTDEIVLRGYLDKTRDAIIDACMKPGASLFGT